MAWFKRQKQKAAEGIPEARLERVKADAQLKAAQEYLPKVRKLRGDIDNLGREYEVSFTPRKAG